MSDYHQMPPPPGPMEPMAPATYGTPVAMPHQTKNHLGMLALGLGITGIILFGLFAAVPAIFVGRASQKAQAQGLADNGNLGQIGLVLGIVGCAIWGIIGVFVLVFLVLPVLMMIFAFAVSM